MGRDAVEVVDILARNVCTDTLDKMAYVVVGHGVIGNDCGGSMVNVYNVQCTASHFAESASRKAILRSAASHMKTC